MKGRRDEADGLLHQGFLGEKGAVRRGDAWQHGDDRSAT